MEFEKSNSTLVGFNGKEIRSIENINLPVMIGGVTQLTTFLMIDSSSAYNAILNRPWIHVMKVVSSTFY